MSEPTLHELERELHGTELTCRGAGYDETRPGQIARALLAYTRELRAALAAIIADHDERVSAWGESEQQPHRVARMEHGRAVLACYPEEPGQGGTTP